MTDILIISTADWDHPIWTNKQHVSCSLADLGFRILYVESLGLRGANKTGKDRARIFKRLKKGLSGPQKVRSNIWVVSPLVIPGGSRGFFRQFNRLILQITLKLTSFLIGFRYQWLWTYNPLTLRFLNLKLFKKSIYHAVDAIHEQPDMPRDLIIQEEQKLCKQTDLVFVTSPQIKRDLKKYTKQVFYEPNCCDYSHFSRAMDIKKEHIPSDIKDINTPIVGFMGAISNYKLDFELIYSVSLLLPKLSFVFIGPSAEGERITDISLLEKRRNIYLIGHREYKYLPMYCAAFDVAWLPLKKNKYTQSMFPMKFFEYLASGLPVVASSIDSLKSFDQQVFLCDNDAKCFSIAIMNALKSKNSNLENRLALAKYYDYKSRTKRMLDLIKNNEKLSI